MDLEKLIEAVKLCGSTPKVDQCKQCAYWAGGDMSRCIPNMTGDAATELSTLQAEVEFWKYRCNESVSHASELDMALYDTEAENEKLRAELEQVKQERDAAIKEIFQWTGCPACKHWDSADNWCNKHDRSADSCDGCSTPEWHGLEKA